MIEQLVEQAVVNGFVTCPHCGNRIEPDAESCCCGWQNPLVGEGWNLAGAWLTFCRQ